MEYGCIGSRLGHSFSVDVHRALADYEYSLLELSADELGDFMSRRDFRGINVTIPYKEAVIPYLDHIDINAAKIGAVNTVVNRGGKLYGYNTDFVGMTALIRRYGIEIKGKKVLILGTGGTSKTSSAVAENLGAAEVTVVSRSPMGNAVSYDDAYRLCGDADILINTTPVGMFGTQGGSECMPIDISGFPKLSGVVDAVYNPLSTHLVGEARERGIASCGGLFMLVAQAVGSSELFTGRSIGETETETVYGKLRSRKENIVLIGMPEVGKTTVGRIIAEKLSRRYVDTDEMIVQETRKSPAEIIISDGEAAFRRIESDVIRERVSLITEAVIATGGGAVLDRENVARLKRNGSTVWLRRNPDKVELSGTRPLTPTRARYISVLEERSAIYRSAADRIIDAQTTAEATADRIIEMLGKDVTYENSCAERP